MSYDEYIKSQIHRAEKKWARRPTEDKQFRLNLYATWLGVEKLIESPKLICCMGVRDGTEVMEFKKYCLKARVWGVDITENIKTIKLLPWTDVFLQDFNKLPDDWADKIDLVYSNSIDHAFKPEETLKEWHRATKQGGHLLLEFSVTPPNGIEHSFTIEDVDKLLPPDMFTEIRVWVYPKRNMIIGLWKVIK